MRPQHEYDEVMRLLSEGLNDCEISRRTGIPRETVRDWRVGREVGSPGRTKFASPAFGGKGGLKPSNCPRCDGRHLDKRAYSYLLGQYLGDGTIVEMTNGVHRLGITCTAIYTGIIQEVAAHIVIVRGRESFFLGDRRGCVNVYNYWKHWPCVFPQDGEERKHLRPIVLEPWQQAIVETYPKELLRGLMHSDGSRHINTVTRPLKDGPKSYRYPRYMFTNASADILRIFTDICDLVGVHWTRTNRRNVAVSRRKDVAFLDTFIGPKS